MILVDTGAWLALADKGDAYHARCVAFFRSSREPLMTTYPVLVECVHLIFRRTGGRTSIRSVICCWCRNKLRHAPP